MSEAMPWERLVSTKPRNSEVIAQINDVSILSSAERSEARIEGCELADTCRTLRYGFRSATAYSGCYL